MTGLIMYVLPYVLVFALGVVLGFLSRMGTIDTLRASMVRLRAEMDGTEIRSGRTDGAVPAVEPRSRVGRPVGLASAPGHSAARTASLPKGVRYVAAAEVPEDGDEIMTDAEYAEVSRRTRLAHN